MVLERRQLGGVVPVMAMVWKSWQVILWNAGGMCVNSTLGMLSGPRALLPGNRRRASWKIAGVGLSMIMFLRVGRLLGIAVCQGNGLRVLNLCLEKGLWFLVVL